MTLAEIKAALDDTLALALTLWAEARGDAADGSSLEERVAVGCVVRNRHLASGRRRSYKQLVLAPLQFSCWNDTPSDDNHRKLKALAEAVVAGRPHGDQLLEECLYLASGIIRGKILDRTGGALNYYAPKAMVPAGTVPSWAKGKPGKTIGSQVFLVA
jgi:hypothetical protein